MTATVTSTAVVIYEAPREIPRGRPTLFRPELAEEICDAIATTPRGLDYLCAMNPHWPSSRTIWRWVEAHEKFRQSYLRAHAQQAALLAFEALEIADDASRDTKWVGPAGAQYEVMDAEWVARSKLRVETRLRMAGKLDPKKWGERATVEHTGEVTHRPVTAIDPLEAAKEYRRLMEGGE